MPCPASATAPLPDCYHQPPSICSNIHHRPCLHVSQPAKLSAHMSRPISPSSRTPTLRKIARPHHNKPPNPSHALAPQLPLAHLSRESAISALATLAIFILVLYVVLPRKRPAIMLTIYLLHYQLTAPPLDANYVVHNDFCTVVRRDTLSTRRKHAQLPSEWASQVRRAQQIRPIPVPARGMHCCPRYTAPTVASAPPSARPSHRPAITLTTSTAPLDLQYSYRSSGPMPCGSPRLPRRRPPGRTP